MKTIWKNGLSVLAGVFLGASGMAIHAQQKQSAPGYVVAEVEATDPAAMQKYAGMVPETLAPFHHQYVILGGKTQSLEGEPPKGGIVMIKFDSVEKAREWYDSAAYAAVRPIRQAAAKSRIFIVEGLAPQ